MEHKEESKPPSPYVECGKIPKAKFVKDKSDMEDIEVRGECSEDPDIARLKKKVGRNMWKELTNGYLSLDFNLEN